MTSSAPKIKAAANGGTSTDLTAHENSAKPMYGFARLRESEVYHLMGLAQSALDEAGHTVRKVHDMACKRWLDHQGTSEPLDTGEISELLSDAYQCAIKAVNVIDDAAMHWLDGDLAEEPVSFVPR